MRMAIPLLLILSCLTPARAGTANPPPDPQSVQRYGPAYRYPRAGWIVLHLEGAPYERGFQHGKLLAPELAATVRTLAAEQSARAPGDGYKRTRTLINALFLRRYEREYLEEMKGIADGANAGGAKFEGRALDLLDVVAINGWSELDSLEEALNALPTGLEGVRFPKEGPRAAPQPKGSHCSAFAAMGSATRDGKIVFGHINMCNLDQALLYNVWLDVKPAKGHRILMQTCAGGIQSGTDYYLNDAGLLVTETTLSQTRFDPTGMTLASRVRKAVQYGENIDQFVAILKEANNGLYTNEWLLGDIKTNEIAMFELGTRKSKLWRSSKNEWFGGTEGFYWGCNNTKDLDVRLETVASLEGQPQAVLFQPSNRDKAWLELYDRYRGKIDADFGKTAFSTPPVVASHSADAKFTTADQAKQLQTWARFGPPLGRAWEPTKEEREQFPDIHASVSHPWTVLHGEPPPAAPAVAAVDVGSKPADSEEHEEDAETLAVPAWRGTILPKSDADYWLATAFASYERIVAREHALREAGGGTLSAADQARMARAVFAYRSEYELAARAGGDIPLSKIRSDVRHDEWARIASGKGVLLLHALRQKLGEQPFDDMMDRFGRENAGRQVTTAAFRAAVEKAAGKDPNEFFDTWLNHPGLPDEVRHESGPFSVTAFHAELKQTLIVYGSGEEATTNREAAEALQQAIRSHGSNLTVPVRSDREVTTEELRGHHLLLIGRPGENAVTERLKSAFPVTFGSRSFVVGEEIYADAGSAIVAAAPNSANTRYSAVVIAGLDAYSTWKTAPQLLTLPEGEVVILPSGGAARALVGVVAPSTSEGRTRR